MKLPALGVRNATIVACLYAAAYMGNALLVRQFSPPGGFSPWYPPAGVMMALLVVLGPRWLPLVFAVRIANVMTVSAASWRLDARLEVERAVVICCTYAIAAWLLRRRRIDKAHTNQFGWFAGICVVAAPTVAGAGLALLDSLRHDVRFVDALSNARVFWVGDALAIATIVPLVLLVLYAVRYGQRVHLPASRVRRAEAVVQAGLIFVVPLTVAILQRDRESIWLLPVTVLPLVWVALRQDLVFAAAGVFATSAVSAFAVKAALPADRLLEMQSVLLTGALAALYAGAVRRTHEDLMATVVEGESRFAELVRNAPVHVAQFAATNDATVVQDGVRSDNDSRTVRGLRARWADFGPGVIGTGHPTTFDWTDDGDPRLWFVSTAGLVRRADGTPAGVLVVTTDRTEVEEARHRSALEARRDPLTSLPTRHGLLETIDELRHIAGDTSPIGFGVVLLNDADVLTVADGDDGDGAVTVEVAGRVARAATTALEVGRVGQRTFAFATFEAGPAGGRLPVVADKVFDALQRDISVDGRPTSLTITIGTASGAEPAHELLRRAELAAHSGHAAGGNRVVEHSRDLEQGLREHRTLVADLRRATERRELEAWFQPIVTIGDRRVVGAEVLARWRHPERGMLPPAEFIGLAEQTGLIGRVDLLMLEAATQCLLAAGTQLHEDFYLSVNLAQRSLEQPDLIDGLQAATDGIDPRRIRLEITETTAMRDPVSATRILGSLQDLGYGVILDDFGTGYSSMAWLHRLPVHALKIDRSFISQLPADDDSKRIVGLVTSLAQDLDITVIAEGVETEAQVSCIAELGCPHAQGYLFGRPAPALLAPA